MRGDVGRRDVNFGEGASDVEENRKSTTRVSQSTFSRDIVTVPNLSQ
jgi:hypothetical protein